MVAEVIMFAHGRSLIATLDHKGKTYNFCVFYDAELNELNTQFIEGDFQAPNLALLWASPWMHIPDQAKDPRAVVENIVAELNAFLKKQFSDLPPVTWADQLEALLRKIIFFPEAGIPQVRLESP